MARFSEAFNVIEGDGSWSSGAYPIDTLNAGFMIGNYDICNPDAVPDPPESAMGRDVSPFAVKAYLEGPTRCTPAYAEEFAVAAMESATEYQVTKALWEGPLGNTGETFLLNDEVDEVARAADLATTLGNVLARAHEKAPQLRPVIHLGYTSAITLQFGLANLGIPYVMAPGYPTNAVAVTGPVTVRLGSLAYTTQVNPKDNRKQVEVTRLAAIEFDPFLAVRAADSV